MILLWILLIMLGLPIVVLIIGVHMIGFVIRFVAALCVLALLLLVLKGLTNKLK